VKLSRIVRAVRAAIACDGGVFGSGAIQTANLANGSVTRLKLADNAPVSKSANYNVVAADKYASFIATAAMAFNLPAANAVNAGFRVEIKSQTEQSVTIARAGADTLDTQNVATYQLPSYCGVTVQSDGVSDWKLLNRPDIDVGRFVDFGGGTLPLGYVTPDGSNRLRSTYGGLFAAYGTTWGAGDGATTFGTPDARRRSRVGSGGVGTATLGNAVGNIGGEENHPLTSAENGAHGHPGSSIGVNTNANDGTFPGAIFLANAIGPVFTGDGTQTTITGGLSASVASSGSGTGHNTIQPSMVCTVGIKT
jgi:microcystin-dependent protein